MLAIIAALGLSSCSLFNEERIDTRVEWGWAKEENSPTTFGIEALLPSSQKIYDAFDEVFCREGDPIASRAHEINLKAQTSEKNALKNAKNLAEKAAAKLPADHTCLVDYIFVVNIYYGFSGTPKTAWSHDYRPKN